MSNTNNSYNELVACVLREDVDSFRRAVREVPESRLRDMVSMVRSIAPEGSDMWRCVEKTWFDSMSPMQRIHLVRKSVLNGRTQDLLKIEQFVSRDELIPTLRDILESENAVGTDTLQLIEDIIQRSA